MRVWVEQIGIESDPRNTLPFEPPDADHGDSAGGAKREEGGPTEQQPCQRYRNDESEEDAGTAADPALKYLIPKQQQEAACREGDGLLEVPPSETHKREPGDGGEAHERGESLRAEGITTDDHEIQDDDEEERDEEAEQ